MVYLLGHRPRVVALRVRPVAARRRAERARFDFFFVPPYFSFAVTDLQHIVTFAVMFVVAVVISNLTQAHPRPGRQRAERERRTASLYALSRELGGHARATAAARWPPRAHVHEVFDAKVALLLPERGDELELAHVGDAGHASRPTRRSSASPSGCATHGKPAGAGTDTLPVGAGALPAARRGRAGASACSASPPPDGRGFSDPTSAQLLEAFASQIGSALERTPLADEAQQAQLQIEAERLRSSLLSSVSHDLRTPLAVITGAASTLLEERRRPGRRARRELSQTITRRPSGSTDWCATCST